MLPPAETSGGEAGRRALLLSIGAVALTMLAPTLGLALGVLSIVLSVRAWRALSRKRLPLVTPVLGVIVSTVTIFIAAGMVWVQTYFGNELGAYTECMKGAGTGTSQQVCLDQLERAVERKLPFMPKGSFNLPLEP